MNERISTLSHLIPPLLEWFRDNQRTLPWRSDPQPYQALYPRMYEQHS